MNAVRCTEAPFVPPENIFPALRQRRHCCWLDTCGGRRGSYSLLAADPFLTLIGKGRAVTIETAGKKKTVHGNPFTILRDMLDQYRVAEESFFSPGALGFIGYDLGRHIEKVPEYAKDDLGIPDMWLGFYDRILVFDHGEKKLRLLALDNAPTGDLEKLLEKSRSFREINPILEKPAGITSNMSHDYYVRAVKKVRDYIAAGDVYQINFSQRLKVAGKFRPDALYARMRRCSPTAWSGFLDAGDFQLLSNSPELFVVKDGKNVATRPMKGTRPRGKTPAEDKKYRRELLTSGKDRAELIMIVDLERNDLGKVCEYGSVHVNKTQILEKYKTVYQTTSQVEGTLKDGVGPVDLLTAIFPGGSITGAPKIRAMEIIEELEPTRRSFYTGGLGYIGFNGNMEFNILIRTLLVKNRALFYPVGGGIVWDSDPEEEYRETLTKAEVLFRTLGITDEQDWKNVLV